MEKENSAAAAATATSASSSAPSPAIDLSLMYPRSSAADQLRDLASYLDLHANDPVSVPSFPAPQVISNDPLAPPPVWPAYERAVPPCTFPLSQLQQPVLAGSSSDQYGGGAHLAHFEAHVANLLGKQASMFCVSGTMSQLIALRIHSTGRNRIFACHPKGHIVNHEANSYDVLMGFSALLIGSPSRPMSSAEVEAALAKHWKQPCALVLELPERELGGAAIEWDELCAIRALCAKRDIKLHLDGARLWEAQSYYRRSLQEICSLFDSVYVSYYKGLQSTCSGAMLVGSEALISEARQWQHRMGGRLWSQMPLIVAAERALNTNLGSFERRANKLREIVAAIMDAQASFVQSKENDDPKVLVRPAKKKATAPAAAASSSEDTDKAASSSASTSSSSAAPFHPFFHFVPAVPTCSLVHMSLRCSQAEAESLRDAVRAETGIVLFNRVRAASSKECLWEWNMGTSNSEIPVDTVIKGWSAWISRRYEQLREAQRKAAASM